MVYGVSIGIRVFLIKFWKERVREMDREIESERDYMNVKKKFLLHISLKYKSSNFFV